MQKPDGSGKITRNGNMVFKDGQYVGQVNQFGETVTDSGSYRNVYGDIVDSNGNNVGHVYGNTGHYTTNGSSGYSGSSSGADPLPTGCIVFAIAVIIILAKIYEVVFAVGIIGTMIYEGFSSGSISEILSEYPWLYVVFAVIILLCSVVVLAKGSILKKTIGKFWPAFIPVFNEYKLIKVAGGVWYILLVMFMPIGFIVVDIYRNYKLGKEFGKETGFIVGMTLLPFIFLPRFAKSIDVSEEDDFHPTYLCHNCLAEITKGVHFCPNCGNRLEHN